MADVIDKANEQAQLLNELETSARLPIPVSEPTGECLTCGEVLGTLRKFCNGVCAGKF
jgi:hypothetical protein